MDITYIFGITLAGVCSGALAGLVGGGGEIIIVPLLTIFGIYGSIKMRIGTTLCMLLPPIGILAALKYYRKGYVDVKAALYMGLLFTIFSSMSSKYSINMEINQLKKIYGVFMVVSGIYIYYS